MELLEALESYGVEYKPGPGYPDSGEIRLCCPFCLERNETQDTRFRLGVNVKTGKMHCFNCDMASSDAVITFKLLDDKLELGELELAQKSVKKKKRKRVHLPEDFEVVRPCTKEDDYWRHLAWKYLHRRGVTVEQARQYNIGYSLVGEYAYRIVFPVYYRNKLFAIVARDFTGKSTLKYKNSEGDKALYGAPRSGHESRSALLVEGIFDALAVMRGVKHLGIDAMGVLGHVLTPLQLKQLAAYRRTYLWFDPDKAGVEGDVHVARQLQSEYPNMEVFVIMPQEEDYDPSDFAPPEIAPRIRHALPFSPTVVSRLTSYVAFQE